MAHLALEQKEKLNKELCRKRILTESENFLRSVENMRLDQAIALFLRSRKFPDFS